MKENANSPIWLMSEQDFKEMRTAVNSGTTENKYFGSLYLGSLMVDFKGNNAGNVDGKIYVKGYDGYDVAWDDTPYAPADNVTVSIAPDDYKSFINFRKKLEGRVKDLATLDSLGMTYPLVKGCTSDPKKILEGANGVWA